MPDITAIIFMYSDGKMEYALGDHAKEVMEWYNAGQSMSVIHGGQYTGRKMVEAHPLPKEAVNA